MLGFTDRSLFVWVKRWFTHLQGCVNGNLPLAQVLPPDLFPSMFALETFLNNLKVLYSLIPKLNSLQHDRRYLTKLSGWLTSLPSRIRPWLHLLGVGVLGSGKPVPLGLNAMCCRPKQKQHASILQYVIITHEWPDDSSLTLKEDFGSFATLITLKQSSTTSTLHTTIHGYPNRLNR